jgi:hypothetical protein
MSSPLRVLHADDEPSLLIVDKLYLEKEGTFAAD